MPALPKNVIRVVREDYTAQPGAVKIDTELGEAYDVKILGWTSRNGGKYNPTKCSLPESVQAYEGAVSNIDHAPDDRAHGFQPFASRFARVYGPYAKADGIYATRYKYNKAHPLAKTFEYWCQNDPGAVGFSQIAYCRTDPAAPRGETVYEQIVKVSSVDLVANPATTQGIYESYMEPTIAPVADAAGDSYETQVGQMIAAIVTDANLSLADKRKKVLAALKLIDEPDASDAPDTAKETESLRATVKQLSAQLDTYQVKEAAAAKRAQVIKLCDDAKLSKEYVTEVFIANLIDQPDLKRVQESIEDRRALTRGDAKPLSAGQDTPQLSLESFLKEIRK